MPEAQPKEEVQRQALVAAARALEATGLNVNASGNLSVRVGDGVLVTPSGIDPHQMTPQDCVFLRLANLPAGAPPFGDGPVPTSEWRLHMALMHARPRVRAIVHIHSPEATAASTLRRPVPAVHYVAARFGPGTLRCADYATYGSQELADNVTRVLADDANACLMANHGAVVLAADLTAAVALARDLEWFCGVYRRAHAVGQPVALPDTEIARVAAEFATYGQNPG